LSGATINQSKREISSAWDEGSNSQIGLRPESWSEFRSEKKKVPMAKILLVEDNEMNRDMLSRRLIRQGFTIVMALDGEQGVKMAESENPDLILMDMSLPVLTGWEATKQLKSAPKTQHIPVIALTAHAMASDEQRAREAGCDDYDTKPIELPRLLGKIKAQLEKRPAAESAG
jgi:CheY-like chemotaxis protein